MGAHELQEDISVVLLFISVEDLFFLEEKILVFEQHISADHSFELEVGWAAGWRGLLGGVGIG